MTGLLGYVAETGTGLALFYGLYRLVLKNDTHFQVGRLYLVGSLVAAHLLPLLHVTSPFRQVVIPALPPAGIDFAGVPAGGWDWGRALLWVYVAGAVFVFLRLAWHLRHLLLIISRQPVVHRAGVRVVYVDEDCPPFSFFRTAFVQRPVAGDEHVLDQVVAHERTHIRQAHTLDILLIQLAAIGQWFNPFAWLYKTALKELHEYLADRDVLAQGFDPFTYRHILFEQHLGARSFEFAHHLRESQIKRRLAMMTRRSGRWTVCKYLLALPALALLVFAFADPQVVVARDAAAFEPAAAATPVPQSAGPAKSAAKQQADDAATIEKKKIETEFKKNYLALEEQYRSTSDPARKKAIEAKMLQMREEFAWKAESLALSDPAAVEDVLTKTAQKLKQLEAKMSDTADEAVRLKLKKDILDLTKRSDLLKARLAELQAGK